MGALSMKRMFTPMLTENMTKGQVLQLNGDDNITYVATVVEVCHLFGLSYTLGECSPHQSMCL
jgi:hypothetical protein